MKTRWWALGAIIWVTADVSAQTPVSPQTLPPTILGGAGPKSPFLPDPAAEAKRRQAELSRLSEDLVTFDPNALAVRRIDGRWIVAGGDQALRDFGQDRPSADDALRTLQELRVNRRGSVAGGRPPFEYWLVDSKAPKTNPSRRMVIPLNAKNIRAESVSGAWIVTDGSKVLYDFGSAEESARTAANILLKHGFNELGLIGTPRPVMYVPLVDAYRPLEESRFRPLDPRLAVQEASNRNLLLAGNVNAGPKTPFDPKKLEVVRVGNDWRMVFEDRTLAQFGTSELNARTAARLLTDARPTEIAWIGHAEIPIYLSGGMPLRSNSLTIPITTYRNDRLQIKKVREQAWLFEDNRPIIEVGRTDDAELLAFVIRRLNIDSLAVCGRADQGGLRMLFRSR